MGGSQSQPAKFNDTYAKYKSYVNSIETESVKHVYGEIMKNKFTSTEQMLAVSIYIYDKAITMPELSSKCAQLVKEFECDGFVEDDKAYVFRYTFNEFFMNTMCDYIENYDDSKLNPESTTLIINVAKFLGNIFIVDVFDIQRVIKIAKLVKKHGTPKTFFFMENVLSIISIVLTKYGVSRESFENFVENYDFPEDVKFRSESYRMKPKMFKFLEYICKVRRTNSNGEYVYNDDSEMDFKETHDDVTSGLIEDVINSPKNLALYEDILVGVYNCQQQNFKRVAMIEFKNAIERYEAKSYVNTKENVESFAQFGNAVVKLYNLKVIDNDYMELFLDTAKSTRLPNQVFRWTFLEVVSNYEGAKLMDYAAHLKRICSKNPDLEAFSLTVDDYVKHLEDRKSKEAKTNKFSAVNAIALPDFCKYWCSDLKHIKPFECANRPSCHLAASKSIQIMTNNIGNKFFTVERIGILTKMTKKWRTIPNQERVGDDLEYVFQHYKIDYQRNTKPNLKYKNFTNLLVSLYKEGLILNNTMEKWFTLLLNTLDTKHKFHNEFLQIYLTTIDKVLINYLRDDMDLWLKHIRSVDTFELKMCEFNGITAFKDIVMKYHQQPELMGNSIRALSIPSDRITMKRLTKILLDIYVMDELSETYISSVYAVLFDQFKITTEKTLFRSEMQNALCQILTFLCAMCKGIGSKYYNNATRIIDLIEAMCRKTQITRLGLAKIFYSMTKLADLKADVILSLMRMGTAKFGQCFKGANPLPMIVEKTIVKIIENIESADRDATDILEIFRNILDENKKKKVTK